MSVTKSFWLSVYIKGAVLCLTIVFFQSVPPEVAVNSDAFLQTLADVIVMISPISPGFAGELWEGFRSKVTACRTYDMVSMFLLVLFIIIFKE